MELSGQSMLPMSFRFWINHIENLIFVWYYYYLFVKVGESFKLNYHCDDNFIESTMKRQKKATSFSIEWFLEWTNVKIFAYKKNLESQKMKYESDGRGCIETIPKWHICVITNSSISQMLDDNVWINMFQCVFFYLSKKETRNKNHQQTEKFVDFFLAYK